MVRGSKRSQSSASLVLVTGEMMVPEIFGVSHENLAYASSQEATKDRFVKGWDDGEAASPLRNRQPTQRPA